MIINLLRDKKSIVKSLLILIVISAAFFFLISMATIIAENETQTNQTNGTNQTIGNETNETNLTEPPIIEPECLVDEDCYDNNELTTDLCIENICYHELIEPPSNATNQTIGNETNITELIQEPAEIGKPVQWKVKVKALTLKEAKQNLPKEAKVKTHDKISDESFEINYETPAPEATEEKINDHKKIITITAPELNYTNILIYTDISETVKGEIKLYWLVDNSRQEVAFTIKDTNDNGVIDRIEWIVPHLSNQTYEIIVITKAEHLDENRIFISDIYNETYQLDGIWSEEIPNEHYVRVTFEIPLSNNRDITIYPHVVSGNPRIEVYEVNTTDLIAEFTDLVSNEYNKVLLTDLEGSQDTFDLKVVEGSVELDHIIDPIPYQTSYDFWDTRNKAYWSQSTTNNLWATVTEASAGQYTDLKTDDAAFAVVCSTSQNDFPFWRMNITINQTTANINWMNVSFNGLENGTGPGETATVYVYNWTSRAWLTVGTLLESGNNTVSVNYTSGFNTILNPTTNNLTIAAQGASFDSGECVNVDYVRVIVGGTDNDPLASFGANPINYYNSTSQTLTFETKCSDDIGVNNLQLWSNWSGSWQDNQTNSSPVNDTFWNVSVGLISEGTYVWAVWCNDSAGNGDWTNTNRTLTIDLTKPYNITLNLPVDTFNTTSQNLSFNFTAYDNMASTINCSLYLDSVLQTTNSSTLNATLTDFNLTNIAEGSHQWNISCIDLAGNSNTSETRTFIVDFSPPNVTSITLTPSSIDDIDPNVQINATANLTDLVAIDTVIFQYKQASAGDWTNDTMDDNSSNVYVNATFTPNLNGVWNYRIWANDSLGNSGYNPQTNLTVEYEYTWNISNTSFGTVSGVLNSNTSLETLTINNTGDYTLNFDLSHNAPYGMTYNETEPFDLAANTIKKINITVNFGPTAREDSVTIRIDATSSNADPSERNITLTLVSYAGGAYIYNTLISYPTTVNQSSLINLYGSVKNIGNETALNTILSWIVPSSYWTNVSGNLTQEPSNVTADSTIYNNVTINVSSSVSPGPYTIYLNSTCDNNVSTCSDLESFTIYVYCSSSDGVCGAGCSYETSSANYDSDCSAPPPGGPGGGGAGGGGGAIVLGPETIVYSKTIEIVRGEEDSFEIEVKNNYIDSALEDLTLDLTGFPSQYITISPSKIDRINPGETKNFSVKLKIPPYKESYEEYTLKAVILGYKVDGIAKQQYTEIQNIKLIIQEISREASNLSLSEAEKAILEMKNAGFNTQEVSKLLEQAKLKLSEKRNKESQILSQQIIMIRDKAVTTDNLIRRVAEALQNPKKSYLLVGDVVKEFNGEDKNIPLENLLTGKTIFGSESTRELLELAIAAFERGDYNTAEERAKSAQSALLLERKGDFGLFLYMYWHFILIGLLIFSFAGVLSYKTYQKSSITKRVGDINKEEDNIRSLISSSQKDYFSGKISAGQYHGVMSQHQNKLAKIKQERLSLRNKRIKMLKPQQILQDLGIERMQVENGIKKLQGQFYRDKKISENEYNTEFKILNERLAEIEGEKITLELLKQKKLNRIKF